MSSDIKFQGTAGINILDVSSNSWKALDHDNFNVFITRGVHDDQARLLVQNPRTNTEVSSDALLASSSYLLFY